MEIIEILLYVSVIYLLCRFVLKPYLQSRELEHYERDAGKYYLEARERYKKDIEKLKEEKEDWVLGDENWKERYQKELEDLQNLNKFRDLFIRTKEKMKCEPNDKRLKLYEDWCRYTYENHMICYWKDMLLNAPDGECIGISASEISDCRVGKDEIGKRLLTYI